MTDLTKKVTRRVIVLLDNRTASRDRDKVAVTLYPDGFIGFRVHKTHKEHMLPIAAAYLMAMKHTATEEWKMKERKAKVAGKKARKPKRGLLFLK